ARGCGGRAASPRAGARAPRGRGGARRGLPPRAAGPGGRALVGGGGRARPPARRGPAGGRRAGPRPPGPRAGEPAPRRPGLSALLRRGARLRRGVRLALARRRPRAEQCVGRAPAVREHPGPHRAHRDRAGERLQGRHMSASDRVVIGDGDIPLRRLCGALADAGYDGWYDIELLGPAIEAEGYEAVVPWAIARFRGLWTGGRWSPP